MSARGGIGPDPHPRWAQWGFNAGAIEPALGRPGGPILSQALDIAAGLEQQLAVGRHRRGARVRARRARHLLLVARPPQLEGLAHERLLAKGDSTAQARRLASGNAVPRVETPALHTLSSEERPRSAEASAFRERCIKGRAAQLLIRTSVNVAVVVAPVLCEVTARPTRAVSPNPLIVCEPTGLPQSPGAPVAET